MGTINLLHTCSKCELFFVFCLIIWRTQTFLTVKGFICPFILTSYQDYVLKWPFLRAITSIITRSERVPVSYTFPRDGFCGWMAIIFLVVSRFPFVIFHNPLLLHVQTSINRKRECWRIILYISCCASPYIWEDFIWFDLSQKDLQTWDIFSRTRED